MMSLIGDALCPGQDGRLAGLRADMKIDSPRLPVSH